jgi:hypothetical protein
MPLRFVSSFGGTTAGIAILTGSGFSPERESHSNSPPRTLASLRPQVARPLQPGIVATLWIPPLPFSTGDELQ